MDSVIGKTIKYSEGIYITSNIPVGSSWMLIFTDLTGVVITPCSDNGEIRLRIMEIDSEAGKNVTLES